MSRNIDSYTRIDPESGDAALGVTAGNVTRLFNIGSAAVEDADAFVPASTDALVPAGAVESFAMDAAPTGWLKCNGANISRTEFADLFAAIGTLFGAGDGSTTFGVPDLRGEFVRGWVDNRTITGETGRVFGSYQVSRTHGHRHSLVTNLGTNCNISHATIGGSGTATFTVVTSSGASSMGDPVNNGTHGAPTIGYENAPRNRALLYCIKY